jgi:hypothetical protein
MDTKDFLLARQSIQERMRARREQPVSGFAWWSLLAQIPFWTLASLLLGGRSRRRMASLWGSLLLALGAPLIGRFDLFPENLFERILRVVPFLGLFGRKSD